MANKPNLPNIDSIDNASQNYRNRWSRGTAKEEMIQATVRMPESTYVSFKELCEVERRTNGQMFDIILAEFLKSHNKVGK